MSTIGENICTIGARFREERDRLGLSQATLASKIFTSDRTIKNYEADQSAPRANELARFADLGGDVLYIVTGERQPLIRQHGVEQPVAVYSAAADLAKYVARLDLSDTDAALLKAFAGRLAG